MAWNMLGLFQGVTMKPLSSMLKKIQKHGAKSVSKEEEQDKIEALKLKMLRIQQGTWHQKKRVIILFEGFDAAGKGGAIRRIVEPLDPRGVKVYSVGPPSKEEQGRHYLYRFWTKLPEPGTIAIFDRSWYGRVLVERVDRLIPEERWKDAYDEINEFEKTLTEDGIEIIKIFLGITKGEQLKRFEDRLNDPYKQWKLNLDDVKARKKWKSYVEASDDLLAKTSSKHAKWHLIEGDDKNYARLKVLTIVTDKLHKLGKWMDKMAETKEFKSLKKEMKKLEKN
jgi:PPK2 family polyphosphate:nucleotide phosphotransferase